MKLTAKQSSKRAPLEKTFITGRGWRLKPRPSFLTAFTIIELMTVMSVIIILFGLLVPAMNRVRRHARRVKQNNQFRTISVVLELFNNEDEGYPDSEVLPNPSGCTTGAHHLAEALLGRDLQGFDPWSSWNAGADSFINAIYAHQPPANAVEEQESLDRRKGPYLKLENVGAFQISELYTGVIGTGNVYSGLAPLPPAPVLTDVYRVIRVPLPNGDVVKAGAPILYYKANTFLDQLDYTAIDPSQNIFNCQDNEDLIALGKMKDQNEMHHFDHLRNYVHPDGRGARQIFYEAITNPQIRNQPRPYNQDSYILISAGFDGLYGTRDDVFNFGN